MREKFADSISTTDREFTTSDETICSSQFVQKHRGDPTKTDVTEFANIRRAVRFCRLQQEFPVKKGSVDARGE